MNVVGALAKSSDDSTVYFCTVAAGEIPSESIRELQEKSGFGTSEDVEKICCVAVESTDRMQSDRRLVGLIFDAGDYYKTLALKTHANLDLYFRELLEE